MNEQMQAIWNSLAKYETPTQPGAVGVLRPGMYVDWEKCRCGGGCESDLECTFWHHVRKTPLGERRAFRQVQIGRYRVDSLFDCDGESVVVELDGKQYHQACADYSRDEELRQVVDAVIRVPFAAMHFYSHATFCVLGEWFPRFRLRAVDTFCMPVSELQNEIEKSVNPNGDFQTAHQFLEWAEPNFELWGECSGIGWVGSPKAWLKRWDVKPITLSRGHNRGAAWSDAKARQIIRDHIHPPEG